MILSIIVIVLIGVIAYFHYVQGFLSSMISAVCAVFAATLAFGYHETVVESLLGGRAADYAHAMVIVVLFAAIYSILRVIFDSFIPGNIAVPLYVDRGGAAVMGLVTGLCATGVFAIAAQLLPVGPSVAGFARYPLDSSREVVVTFPGQRGADKKVHLELLDETFEEAKKKSLIVPVDELLISFTEKLSNNGSTAGKRPLHTVHPDYLTQLFGQRLGIQVGAKHVAYNAGGANQVSLGGLYRIREAAQIQGESDQIKDRTLKPSISSTDGQLLLVVRTRIDANAAGDDRDRRVRFGLGSVRLVAGGVNWYPIGTLEDSGILFASRLDDFLIMPPDKEMVDFVFPVDPALVLADPAALKSGQPQLKPGSFVEFKRMGRFDVSKAAIAGAPPRSAQVGLQWKKGVLDKKPGSIKVDAEDAPVDVSTVTVSDRLFTRINVGRGDADAEVDLTGGRAVVRGRKLRSFAIDGTVSVQRLAGTAEYQVDQLEEPAGRKLVQLTCIPKGGDLWRWGDLSKFELEDSAGGTHKPQGAWAKVVVGTANHFLGAYDAEKGIADVPQIDGRPLDVYIAFAVPPGTTLTGLKFDGKLISGLNTRVPQ